MHDLIHNRCGHHRHLFSRAIKTVTGTCLDQILDGSLVHIPLRGTLDKVLQRAVRSSNLTLLNDLVDHRPSQCLNRI